MKKSVLFSAIALVLALVPAVPYTAFAQTTSDKGEGSSLEATVFPANQETKLWMVIGKANRSQKVRVEVLDKANKVLYTETLNLRSKAYKQKFDMESITDGLYTFRITDGNKTIEKTFKLSTPGLNEQLPQRYVTMN